MRPPFRLKKRGREEKNAFEGGRKGGGREGKKALAVTLFFTGKA